MKDDVSIVAVEQAGREGNWKDGVRAGVRRRNSLSTEQSQNGLGTSMHGES